MPGSKFWWFRWTRYGKRYGQSMKTEDETLATTRAQAILAEGVVSVESFNPTGPTQRAREIHAVIEDYLKQAQDRHKKPIRAGTAYIHRYILKKFVIDCSIHQVRDITLPKILDWIEWLKDQGKAKETCCGYAHRARSFIKYLVTKKYLPATILEGFTVPENSPVGRKNWLRKDEITKILDEASGDPVLQFSLFCGFDAGLRRKEISEARVGWFDLETGVLDVSNNGEFITKDRDNRTIPLTDRFAEFLQGFLADRDKSQYVLAPEKTVTKGFRRYRYDPSKRVRAHFQRCKVRSSLHDMRRSFASNRVSAGVSIYKVARWLGDGIAVVERSYGHLAPQDNEINRGV